MSYKDAHDQIMLLMLLSVSLCLQSICSAKLTGCGLLLTDRYVGGISLLILLLARIWLNEYIFPSVKQSFKEMLLGVRDAIKAQYLSEHLCGQNKKQNQQRRSFWACFPFFKTRCCMFPPSIWPWGPVGVFSVCVGVCVCVCARTHCWIQNN